MAEDSRLVELLQFYKKQETVTRPEVGVLTGKSVGQIAGTCNRSGITGWPKIDDTTIELRPCQFPVLRNGKRHVCGKDRNGGKDPLCCKEHQGKVWNPDKEKDEPSAIPKPAPVKQEPDEAALVYWLRFYQRLGLLTRAEVGVLLGKSDVELTEVCDRYDIVRWTKVSEQVMHKRTCCFPLTARSDIKTLLCCGPTVPEEGFVCQEHTGSKIPLR